MLILLILTLFLHVFSKQDDYFASWFQEQRNEILDEEINLPIDGVIPPYINGKLARLGPSIYTTKQKNYTNYLDSFGRVTMWTISGKDKTTTFQSAMIRSLLYNASVAEDSISRHITQEKTEPATQAGAFDLRQMDNTDVNAYHFAGSNSFISFTDFYIANEIDLRTLRTLGSVDHNDSIPRGSFFSSSHPGEYIHPVTQEKYLINWLGQKTAKGSRINVYAMGSDLVRKVIGSVDIGFLPYSIHSVLVVGDYVVIISGPVALDFLKTGINLCLSCSSNDNLGSEPTDIFVFSLKSVGSSDPSAAPPTAHVQLSPPDSLFAFHYVGGWIKKNESDHDILVVDVCAYSSMDGVIGEFVLGNLADVLNSDIRDRMPNNCNSVSRIEIAVPLSRKEPPKPLVKNLPIVDQDAHAYRMELISINPQYSNKPYCFAYGLAHGVGSSRYEDLGLIKMDLCLAEKVADQSAPNGTPTVVKIFHQDNIYVGEPIFVPDPTGQTEDSGSLLVMSRDGVKNLSQLLIIDAISFEVVASIDAPFPLMFEFHGQFWPEESL